MSPALTGERICSYGAPGTSPPAADTGTIADALAVLGALLDECLAHAANRALISGDRIACQEAAEAGRRIHQLMARDEQ